MRPLLAALLVGACSPDPPAPALPQAREAGQAVDSATRPFLDGGATIQDHAPACREACTGWATGDPEDPCLEGQLDEPCYQTCLEHTAGRSEACATCTIGQIHRDCGCNEWECTSVLSLPNEASVFRYCPSCLRSGAVGARCDEGGACAAGAVCHTAVGAERGICTQSCETDDDCEDGSLCQASLGYGGVASGASHCLRPCAGPADCPGTPEPDCGALPNSAQRFCL